MEALRWDNKPQLRSPVLVCAFKGWNDAGESASLSIDYLAGKWDAKQFASIDPEQFYDFQVTRPTVRLIDGQTREIEWPEVTLSGAKPPGGSGDAVLLVGNEPNLRWRTFCETIIGVAYELKVQTVVTMGALLADVPHTRPVRITGIAADQELAEKLGFTSARYEGPTGVVGVLHDTCTRAGLRSASLWAPVPHYVSAVSSPKASLALIKCFSELVELPVDTAELEQASEEYEGRLDEAVEREPEVKQLVERLEAQMDEQEISLPDLPSGDSIAQDFQRYLRDQGTGS